MVNSFFTGSKCKITARQKYKEKGSFRLFKAIALSHIGTLNETELNASHLLLKCNEEIIFFEGAVATEWVFEQMQCLKCNKLVLIIPFWHRPTAKKPWGCIFPKSDKLRYNWSGTFHVSLNCLFVNCGPFPSFLWWTHTQSIEEVELILTGYVDQRS